MSALDQTSDPPPLPVSFHPSQRVRSILLLIVLLGFGLEYAMYIAGQQGYVYPARLYPPMITVPFIQIILVMAAIRSGKNKILFSLTSEGIELPRDMPTVAWNDIDSVRVVNPLGFSAYTSFVGISLKDVNTYSAKLTDKQRTTLEKMIQVLGVPIMLPVTTLGVSAYKFVTWLNDYKTTYGSAR